MSFEDSNNNKPVLSKKNKILLACGAIAVLGLMIFHFMYGNNAAFPTGNLSTTQGETTYKRDEAVFPLMYQFEDIPYVVGVPSKGITKVEGGYAYTVNGMGIIVSEVSNARTMLAYSSDMYSSLYAVQSQPDVEEKYTEEGYINGYAATYGVYEVRLAELNKTIYEFAYFLKADKESIVLAATTESKKGDDYIAARDYLISMVNTIARYSAEEGSVTDETEDKAVEAEKEQNFENGSIERQAVLTASQDYEKMCLIFSYINVKATPDECYVLDAHNKKYNAAFVNPGEYGFVVPNVAEGDDITVCIKSKELDGATLTQQEYADYQREQESYKEGTLHVEEDTSMGLDESTDTEIYDETSDSEVSDMKDLLKSAGVDGETLTQITNLAE